MGVLENNFIVVVTEAARVEPVRRAAGPAADAAYQAGFAIGREWAEWSASFTGTELR